MNSFDKKDVYKPVSLQYLFFTFIKIGSTSFGGYSSLVSMAQNILVEKDKTIKDETVIKGFSIASILPGPVAVNTVIYIGYSLKGWAGAMISMIAVLLPSMVLMILFAYLYQKFDTIIEIGFFLKGVIPVVLAIIISAAFNIGKKNLVHYKHYLILIIVAVVQFFYNTYWAYLACFVIGGLLGYIFFKEKVDPKDYKKSIHLSLGQLLIIVVLGLTISLNFVNFYNSNLNVELVTVFSGISLSLFGGGYVMIPMLNEIIVLQKEWLSSTEFMDAITFGQVTPGPILISATFIGYKLNGVLGAILATASIFLPSGLLMIFVSETFINSDKSKTWKAVFEGLKPVVIVFFLSSVLILGSSFENLWLSGCVILISSVLIIRFKVNFLWLMAAFGLLHIFIYV